MTAVQEFDVCYRYEQQGQSSNTIARVYHVSSTQVIKILRKHDVKIRVGGNHDAWVPTEDEIALAAAEIREGKIDGLPAWTEHDHRVRAGLPPAYKGKTVTIPVIRAHHVRNGETCFR